MSQERQGLDGSSLAVSIVSYGTSELVLQSLPSLLAALEPCARARVFIVDNASPGDDADRLEAGLAQINHGGRAELIRSPTNGGFAAGNNVAFAAIRRLDWPPDAILLLNPDAELRPGALAEMYAVLEAHPRAGFVGPRLENPDGTSWIAAFNRPSLATEISGALGLGVLQRRYPLLIPDTDEPTRVDWVTGCTTLIRREAFEALGDMDEGYFLYYEEVDYMLKGQRAGWESWHAPRARVLHDAGAATGVTDGAAREGRQPAFWFQAWARFFSKTYGPVYARITAICKLAAMAIGGLQRRIRGQRVTRPDGFYGDFLREVVFRRLSPPPVAPQNADSPRIE